MDVVADKIDRALDDALSMTFPASDPIAISVPAAVAWLGGKSPLAEALEPCAG